MSKARNRWIGLVFISMAISLVIIDGTIVNTIFPSVIADLNLSSTEVQWVQESYVLVFASTLLVWGSLADKVGRRLVLLIGISIFLAASVWAGYSDSASSMILARVVQGVGGAMVLPTTLSLLNANFQGKERGIAFAVWGATIGGMVAVGPVLGGWFATDFTWRWAFLINFPLGIIILAGLLWYVRESKAEFQQKGTDWVGAALSVVMFGTLVFGLIEGRVYGWLTPNPKNSFEIGNFVWPSDGISVIPVALGIALVFTVLFVLWERARARANKSVLLDLKLFSIASFRNGSVAAMIISLGEFGLLFAIPLWLQNVLGLSPISSGLVLLWLAGGAFLASGIGGALSGKLPPARAVQIGVGLELVGVAGIGLLASTDLGWVPLAPLLLIYGIGIGLATAQLTGVIMVDVPMQQIGQASGSQSTVRQVGSALGIAVLGTMLFTGTGNAFDAKLDSYALPEQQQSVIVDAVVDSAGGAIPGLSEGLQAQQVPAGIADEIQVLAGESFTAGTRQAAVAAGLFLLLGFASTFRLGAKARQTS